MCRLIQVSSVFMLQMAPGRVFSEVTDSDLARIRRFIREAAVERGCDPRAADELVVAVNEAVVNIVHHGYQNRPNEIEIVVGGSEDVFVVILLDIGPPFDPTTVPDPDTSRPLSERPFGGMGVHLMREFCDELRYRREPGGRNELTLLKRKGAK
jgi:serine/threonine-protein kinase RsbW